MVTYVAYLTWAELTTAIDQIDSRLLSPVFIPVLLLVCIALEQVLAWARRTDRRVHIAASVVLVALVAGHFAASVDYAHGGYNNGLGLNERVWVDSPLAQSVAELSDLDDATVYSNAPGGLWAATDLPRIENSPWRNWYRGPPIEGSLETFRLELACAEASSYLVWYTTVIDVTNLFHPLDDLRQVATLEPVSQHPDGTAYFMESIDSTCE